MQQTISEKTASRADNKPYRHFVLSKLMQVTAQFYSWLFHTTKKKRARARACMCVCVCVCVLQYLRKRSHWIPADTETPSVTAAGPPHRTHPQTANRKSNTAKICNKWVITFTHGISKCASVPLTDWRLSVLDPLLRFVLTRTRQHNLCLACQPAAGP